MKKEKILIVLTRFPYPPTDGTRAKILQNILLGLNNKYFVDICFITGEKPSRDQIDYFENTFNRIKIFSISKYKFIFNAFKTLFQSYPIQTGIYFNGEAKKWLLSIIDEYHAVYFHTLRLGRYIEEFDAKQRERILLDFNDAISLNYKFAKNIAPLSWRIIYSIDEKRVRFYELKMLDLCKYFNIVSDRDKKYLLEMHSKNKTYRDFRFSTIVHGIDDNICKYTFVGDTLGLVFIGNLHYPSNYDGVGYFCENIWPKVKKIIPNLKFTVIGKGKELFRKNYPNVSFLGFVDNPYPIIIKHRVFISPIRFGAGMMTKVLDAMALNMPIITTPICADGIMGAVDQENLIVRNIDDVDGWVRSIQDLLNDQSYSMKIGSNARQLIQTKYLNSVVQEQFLELFQKIIANS